MGFNGIGKIRRFLTFTTPNKSISAIFLPCSAGINAACE